MKLTEIDTEKITNDTIKRVFFNTPTQKYEKADCLIIFGCHLKSILDERLKRAIEILKEKNIDNIIISGGIGVKGTFNEAEYMKEFLLNNDIDERKILIENKSTTTEENIINSLEILKSKNLIENKSIVLVSNQVHLRRIGMEFKKLLDDINTNIIYEYPINDSFSFNKIINTKELRELVENEIKKIIRFIKQDIINDEEI